VAFTSWATNLVADDTNGWFDVFVHDRQTGQTERVSLSTAGAQGNAESVLPSITADGRRVAFYSSANTLVAGDTEGQGDVFLHDRFTGVTERLSVAPDGAGGNGFSSVGGGPALSEGGRYVAFFSDAINLVSGPDGEDFQVLVRERPVADFTATPTDGPAPLTVQFTDSSSGSPTTWEWDFGDGGSSIAQSPVHDYSAQGDYTVTLTASDAGGSDTMTKTDYIAVSGPLPPPPMADFSASSTIGAAPLTVDFTDLSTNEPTSWTWDFGDGHTSAQQNPTHEYDAAGRHTVSLTAANAGGSDAETKADYIVVLFPDAGLDHWAWAEILACVEAGIVQGYEDGLYHPDLPVDRGQMAAYVARALAGGDSNVPEFTETPTFPDVGTDHWAIDYVEYAAAANVVGGYPDGTYLPEAIVTRDQMAVYMARSICDPTGEDGLAGYVPADPRNFPDVPVDHWAYLHIEYCVENEVVQGYPEGDYRPDLEVTRDQMAVYVARAFELLD
jgi:PKD repeat protein